VLNILFQERSGEEKLISGAALLPKEKEKDQPKKRREKGRGERVLLPSLVPADAGQERSNMDSSSRKKRGKIQEVRRKLRKKRGRKNLIMAWRHFTKRKEGKGKGGKRLSAPLLQRFCHKKIPEGASMK